MKQFIPTAILIIFAILIGDSAYSKNTRSKQVKIAELKVTSTAFVQNGMIPSKYTCDGADISPPLKWSSGPEGTQSYALISDDPDAPIGTWVHWVIYNIPATSTSLEEDVQKTENLASGALQGLSDFKRPGYGGPCPPGGTHRYFFKVYALDTILKAKPGLTEKQLLKAMEGHILAYGELIGKYSRQ
jgi:Raf kinase inhibitor-like YbhB/YbcL family protein